MHLQWVVNLLKKCWYTKPLAIPLILMQKRDVVARHCRSPKRHLWSRRNGLWRHVVYPLHFGFNRQTQRRCMRVEAIWCIRVTHFAMYFNTNDGDIYWCTVDVGWITGHSYIIYGPLLSGATTVMFEGVPTYPDAGRFWQVIEKHKITQFYTAPTAIRASGSRTRRAG